MNHVVSRHRQYKKPTSSLLAPSNLIMANESILDPTQWLHSHSKTIRNDYLKRLVCTCLADGDVTPQINFLNQIEKSVYILNSIIRNIDKDDHTYTKYLIESISLTQIKTKVLQICDDAFSGNKISKDETEKIVGLLKNIKLNLAEEFRQIGSFISLTITLCAIVHLYSTWHNVLIATNTRKRSREQITVVANKIEEIDKFLQELVNLRKLYDDIEDGPKKVVTALQIAILASEMFGLFVKAKTELSKVEVKISFINQPLDLFKEYTKNMSWGEWLISPFTTNRITNTAETSDVIEYMIDDARVLTNEKLNEFRKDFKTVEEYIMELGEIRKKIEETDKWCDER